MKILLVVTACLLATLGQAQIPVSVGPAHRIRPEWVGVNGNVTGQNMPWNNPALVNGLKKTGAGTIRYPAGTIANYWDWDIGWIDPAVPDSLMIRWVVQQGLNRSHDRYPLENLAKALRETGVTPVFVLNMLSKDLDHSLRGLRKAKALGLPVRFVELGNELYFNLPYESRVFPTPEAYGQTCRNWIEAIKREFPGVQCAVLGTELARNDRQRDWTRRVLAQVPNADAVIFHVYTPFGLDGIAERANNNAGQEGVTNGPNRQPLADRQQTELTLLNDAGAYARMINTAFGAARRLRGMNTPADKEIWATEFNVRADSSAVRGTWANTLFVTAFYLSFLESRQVTLTHYHNIQGNTFGALYNDNRAFGHVVHTKLSNRRGALSAGGMALSVFAEQTQGANSARPLTFGNGLTLQPTGGSAFPALQGWLFNTGKGLIVNFSGQPQTIDVSGQEGLSTYRQLAGGLSQYVQDVDGLDLTTGSISKTLRLPPYSITLLRP
ncbi:hypothetical protein GCM10023189_54910 [Nibrella saemangeumensis]|uniref:Alpha-L-arabinofuranosidase n=1 Tax=Nibrella saemangeumensis TaxID=1084526 RepID=A0ABP8NPV3_9BACT